MSRISARHRPGPAAATSCALRLTGTPAVLDREVDPETGDKKSIYVVTGGWRSCGIPTCGTWTSPPTTSEGRMAQQSASDSWPGSPNQGT